MKSLSALVFDFQKIASQEQLLYDFFSQGNWQFPRCSEFYDFCAYFRVGIPDCFHVVPKVLHGHGNGCGYIRLVHVESVDHFQPHRIFLQPGLVVGFRIVCLCHGRVGLQGTACR